MKFLNAFAEGESEQRDVKFAGIIKELRTYQVLSRQLPALIFFPLFEVGIVKVKEEIQARIQKLLNVVFEHYESSLIQTSQSLCQRYEAIQKKLSQSLQSPEDVAEMDRFKN